MLRSAIISLSKAEWARRMFMRWKFAHHIATRFVAGETREDALRAVRELNERGINASLDHLGENTDTPAEAAAATEELLEILREIDVSGVRSNVSLKLSQIGLMLSDDICRENLRRILSAARDTGNFLRIDMEDASVTTRTLDTLRWAREQGFDNVGIVIQAYLYRSENDVRALLEQNFRIRLCKGAYREPAEVAFPAKKDTDSNYDRLAAMLLAHMQSADHAYHVSADGRFPPIAALATHDLRRIQFAQALSQRLGLTQDAVEYQMLHGIRRDLQHQLAAAGYPVRVYVPYGTHWYPYLMRRLAERPANIWFVLSNLLKDR